MRHFLLGLCLWAIAFPADITAATIQGSQTVKGTQTQSTSVINGTAGAGYEQFTHQSSDPATPGSGSDAVRVFAKSKKLYKVVDNGSGTAVVSEVGSGAGGAGEINYITETNFEDNATTGWATYADAAGVVPVDGISTGAVNITFAVNTSAPLNGLVDAKFSKDAANRQGEGVAYAFKLPPAYRSQLNKLSITYRTTANYDVATEGVSAFIYNVDSGVVIYPNGYNASAPPRLPHSLAGGTIAFGWMPTNTTDDDYRLVLHTGLTGTAAWDLFVDEIVTGPGQLVQGAAVSPTTAYTSTLSGFHANATQRFTWRRVGDRALISGVITMGGAASGTMTFTLPAGMTSAAWGISASNTTATGRAFYYDDGAGKIWIGEILSTSNASTFLIQTAIGTAETWNASKPQTANATDRINIELNVQIAEWSSSLYIAGANINSPAKAGFIQAYAGATAPAGWMLCDGSAISRTTYAQLYANIGTTWGVGDNSTTFNIPDLRGVFAKGAGTTNRAAGKDAHGGYYTGTLGAYATDKLQDHGHVNTVGAAAGTTNDSIGRGSGLDANNTGSVKGVTSLSGGDTARTGVLTEPANASVTYIIKLYDDLQAPAVGFSVAKVGATGLVNNDSSNTAGTAILGDLTGTVPSANYVGEMIGSEDAGTNGGAYSTKSTTAVPTSNGNLVTATLNKGLYLVGFKVNSSQGAGSTKNLTVHLEIGGAAVTNDIIQAVPTGTIGTVATGAIPVRITADSTVLAVTGAWTSGTTGIGDNNHELWVTRIH